MAGSSWSSARVTQGGPSLNQRKLEFRLLGPLEVRDERGPVALGTPQQRALLALLLLNANQVVSRDRLIDELWGPSPPLSAAKLVQVYVSRLRKALDPGRADHGDELLVTQAPGYVLRVPWEEIDLRRFEHLSEDGRRALETGAPELAAETLRQALELWRGAPLADFTFEGFAEAEIGRLEELRLAALEDRIDADLDVGRAELTGELEALIARHPLRERLRGQLMLALYRAGRQSEALAVLRDARERLVEEVGVEPGPALRRLERAILEQDPALDPPATARAEPAAPEPVPVASEATEAFVGRQSELEALTERLDEAIAGGRGSVFLIAGEAGIGKSRLLEELAGRARERGTTVVWGRCWEAGGAPAYWPWIQSLRTYVDGRDRNALRAELGAHATELGAILPELGDLAAGAAEPPPSSDPEAARFRLFEAVGQLLARAARARPLVLVIDDLHAADEPSVLLLRYVATQVADAPLLVVGAYRDVELGRDAPLATAVPNLARERATHRLALTGLDEVDVGRLIEATAGVRAPPTSVQAIHAGTEGNPLFVAEMARLLAAEGRLDKPGASGDQALPLPPGVREVIGVRLGRLSGDCRAVLAHAAVLGREFEFAALVQSGDQSEEAVLDALEEALAAQVISEVPGAPDRLRFGHALIRDTLYADLAGPRRARLHRAAGEALEARHVDDRGPHLAEIAHHYAAAGDAGDPAKAVEYARAAADRAVELFAYEEAVRLHRVAIEALGPGSPHTDAVRCELLLALGDAQARAGEGEEAKSTFLRAAELARSTGLPSLLARAAAGYGGRMVWTRALADDRLVPLLEEGLAAVGEEDGILRVQLLSRLAAALRGEPTRRRRQEVCEESIRIARRLEDPATLAYALAAAESGLVGPDTARRRADEAAETIAIAKRIGDRERLFDGYEHRYWAAWELGDAEQRAADLSALTAVAEELRQPAQLWSALSAQTVLALSQGRFPESARLMERASSTGERALHWNVVSSGRLQDFVLRRERGQLEGLELELRGVVDEFPSPLIHGAVLAYVHARLGQSAEADGILADLTGHDLLDWHADEEWVASICLLAEVCAMISDRTRGAYLYELLVPHVSLNAVAIQDVAFGSVDRPLGLLAALLGRSADAEQHFEQALSMNTRMGADPWVAHTEHEYARMLADGRRPGDGDRARELAAGALSGYRRLGMDAFASEAEDLVRALGA